MKHDGPAVEAEELKRLLMEAGVSMDEGSVPELIAHLSWVLEKNKTLNLTAIKDPRSALRLHVLDSLTALPEVASAPEGLMCDIGTGGGYPGIPLAIATGRETLLVDSIGKKTCAVQGFIDTAGLSDRLRTMTARAEEIAGDLGGSCAVVTMRAVSALPSLVELAAPLLKSGGRLVALKGVLDDEEVARGIEAGRLVGLELQGVRRFSLPEGGEARSLVTFTRVRRSTVALPRRTGLAQSKPLA